MSHSICWVALREISPDAVLEELALCRTGRFGACVDHPVVAQAMSNGWFVILADRCDDPLIEPMTLAKLSRNSELVACSIDDPVMFCSAEGWRNGTQEWHIEHDAHRGLKHLSISGSLPCDRSDVARTISRKLDVSVSDGASKNFKLEVPLQLARDIVGFKHDEPDPDAERGRFEFLLAMPSAPRQAESVNPQRWHFWLRRLSARRGKPVSIRTGA